VGEGQGALALVMIIIFGKWDKWRIKWQTYLLASEKIKI